MIESTWISHFTFDRRSSCGLFWIFCWNCFWHAGLLGNNWTTGHILEEIFVSWRFLFASLAKMHKKGERGCGRTDINLHIHFQSHTVDKFFSLFFLHQPFYFLPHVLNRRSNACLQFSIIYLLVNKKYGSFDFQQFQYSEIL